jgi:site-specific DNA-methyltransferase (adenine-specific)
MQSFLDGKVILYGGDNRDVMRGLADNSIDSIVTDPPYALVSIVDRFGKEGAAPAKGEMYSGAFAGFMGKQWDTGEVAFDPDFWRECLRVLKPGGHLVAFSGTRTYHRLACAIEDAGFEVRDMLSWLYGSGFPKSRDIAFDIEKTLCSRVGEGDEARWIYKSDGAELERGTWRHPAAVEWEGWQTALKPACEPICFARKTIGKSTIVANLLKWFVGALNIDGCRIPTDETITATRNIALGSSSSGVYGSANVAGVYEQRDGGRFPANVLHDGSAEVIGLFPSTAPGSGAARKNSAHKSVAKGEERQNTTFGHDDAGGTAARFFYSAKADAHDRIGSKHPTVKPVDVMQWCVRLVTPKGGLTLDPFAGTGTTGEAAFREGCRAILIEREADYQQDIARRMALALAGPDERKRESIKAKEGEKPFEAGSLFANL